MQFCIGLYFVPCWTREPHRTQARKFFDSVEEQSSYLHDWLAPSSPRFCTSVTLKSSFEIPPVSLTEPKSIKQHYDMSPTLSASTCIRPAKYYCYTAGRNARLSLVQIASRGIR